MGRKQIPRATSETTELVYPAEVRTLQIELHDAINRGASPDVRRRISDRLNEALVPVKAAWSAALDASTASIDAAFAAMRADPVFGRAYVASQRIEALRASEGASFREAEHAGNLAAIDIIHKTDPAYALRSWRKMKSVIRGRLGEDRSPSLQVVSLNPEMAMVQPPTGEGRPVYVYDYATPIIKQLDRIAARPSREWHKALSELFDRSLFDYSLPNVQAWARQIAAFACKDRRSAFRQDVEAAIERACRRSGSPAPAPTTFLSVPEIQKRTGLSRATIYKEVRSGRLPGVTLPGVQVLRVKSTDFEVWCTLWQPTNREPIRAPRRRQLAPTA